MKVYEYYLRHTFLLLYVLQEANEADTVPAVWRKDSSRPSTLVNVSGFETLASPDAKTGLTRTIVVASTDTILRLNDTDGNELRPQTHIARTPDGA